MNKKSIDTMIQAMRREIKRSMEGLKPRGQPRPYFISYLVRHHERFLVWARFGALQNQKKETKRRCFADVRIGRYQYDQVTKGGLADNSDESESYDLTDLPLDDDQDAIQYSLFRLTDARYREAVKAFHLRKARDVSYLDPHRLNPSFIPQKRQHSVKSYRKRPMDEKHYLSLVRAASKVFKEYPQVKNSYVEFEHTLETKVFVSSEGVTRVWQVPSYHLSVYIWYLTKKCNEEITLNYHVANPGELPDRKTLIAHIRAKIDFLMSLNKDGERITSYAGPVLMAPQPAGLFIHEVVGHRLEGNRLLSDDEGRTFKDMIGKKIMHPGITILDDPTKKSYRGQSLVGTYDFDDEGVKPKKTLLVENGVLRSFLTTRAAISPDQHVSNGHARNETFERPISRMGNLIIETKGGKSFLELKGQLIELLNKRNLPFGVILYEVEGGETGTEAYDFQAFLGEITRAVKVFPDGREKPIMGVDFVGTPLSSLNNIRAVGNQSEVDNSYCGAESGTILVSTVAPALLLSNLELQAKDPSQVTPFCLPLPWFKKKRKSSAKK